MTAILEARQVHYSYADGPEALREVSISLEEGEKIALVGPNGAGKSTLMLMWNGILRPDSGAILMRGEPLRYDSTALRDLRRRVGMVFQNPDDQLFAPTVYQDVAFGPMNLGFPREKVERYVGYALAYVGLSGYERRPPHHLSGGEKKRVAIAGVLAMEPEVMVLDEPTSNLDPAGAEEIMEMLDELNLGGKTLIISTHDVDLAYRWADLVLLMDNGQILKSGPPSAVFSEQDLIARTRMKPPLVVDIYRELVCRGVLNGSKPPESVLQLTDLLDARIHGSVSCRPLGRIYLCDVVRFSAKDVEEFLGKKSVEYVGAMGTSAKMLAEREGIRLDFTYGVIDKCILKALIGKSSLILTSGGMVEHARGRISDYGQEAEMELEVVLLDENRPSSSGRDDLRNW